MWFASSYYTPKLLLFVAALCVCSCAKLDPEGAIYTSERNDSEGVIYYLPKTLVEITITPWGIPSIPPDPPPLGRGRVPGADQIKYVVLSVGKSANVADLSRSYSLTYNGSPLSKDNVCAGVSNGLLQTVQADTADQTGAIVVSVARLAGRLGVAPFAAPALTTSATAPAGADVVQITDRTISMKIDPLDPTDRAVVETTIRNNFGLRYRFAVEGAQGMRGSGKGEPCPPDSVCYRTAAQTRLSLSTKGGSYPSFGYARIVNRAVTAKVSVNRAFLVDKVTRLTFQDGVLNGIAIQKPSEGLAAAKLPLTVALALLVLLPSCERLDPEGPILKSNSGWASGMSYYLPKTLVTLHIIPYGHTGGTTGNHDVSQDRVDWVQLKVEAQIQQGQASPPPVFQNVADRTSQYTMTYNNSPLTSDNICAGVSGDGLLQSVEAASADQTGGIIIAIAQLAGRTSGVIPFASGGLPASVTDLTAIADRDFYVTVDPLVQADLDGVAAMIKARFRNLANEHYRLTVEGSSELRGRAAPEPCPADSICYRTAVQTRIMLSDRGHRHVSIDYATVVNRSILGKVNVTRAFLVEKVTKLVFDGGVLKGVAITKPSEGLAAAKLPLTVADAMTTSALTAPERFLSNVSGTDQLTKAINAASTNAGNVSTLQGQLANVGGYSGTTIGPTASIACSAAPQLAAFQ
ncbi:MAG: hypothetical protein WBX25_13855 [Rhodomicrobium sp.]